MTTTAPDKEDVFSRILEKAKADVQNFRLKETNEIETPVERAKESEIWKKWHEDVRTEHKQNPLLDYSYKIHGTVPPHEKSYKEEQEDRYAIREATAEALDEERAMRRINNFDGYKPEGMTKTQWGKM